MPASFDTRNSCGDSCLDLNGFVSNRAPGWRSCCVLKEGNKLQSRGHRCKVRDCGAVHGAPKACPFPGNESSESRKMGAGFARESPARFGSEFLEHGTSGRSGPETVFSQAWPCALNFGGQREHKGSRNRPFRKNPRKEATSLTVRPLASTRQSAMQLFFGNLCLDFARMGVRSIFRQLPIPGRPCQLM